MSCALWLGFFGGFSERRCFFFTRSTEISCCFFCVHMFLFVFIFLLCQCRMYATRHFFMVWSETLFWCTFRSYNFVDSTSFYRLVMMPLKGLLVAPSLRFRSLAKTSWVVSYKHLKLMGWRTDFGRKKEKHDVHLERMSGCHKVVGWSFIHEDPRGKKRDPRGSSCGSVYDTELRFQIEITSRL